MDRRRFLLTSVAGTLDCLTARADEASTDWMAAFQAGVRAIEEDRLSDAITHLQRAIESNPDAREPYTAIRTAYGLRGRRVGEAGLDGAVLRLARQQLDRGDAVEAERTLNGLLQVHFANPGTHLLLEELYTRRGQSIEAARAGKVFRGLLESILATGSGESAETAFLVQSISEEYLIVGLTLRCRTIEQRVLFPPSGGVYDVMRVSCGDAARTVYFDVSAWGPDPAWRLKAYRPGSAGPR